MGCIPRAQSAVAGEGCRTYLVRVTPPGLPQCVCEGNILDAFEPRCETKFQSRFGCEIRLDASRRVCGIFIGETVFFFGMSERVRQHAKECERIGAAMNLPFAVEIGRSNAAISSGLL